MNFDLLAPHYRWLERIVFGRRLQQARTEFVRQVAPSRRVLLVGEGDGRFLSEFLKWHPEADIDCLDASARMIEIARQRTAGHGIRFICADLLAAKLPADSYHLLVTHFFLDCFAEEDLPEVIARLARAAAPGAEWLIAEFQEPARGWLRWPRRWLISLMYLFFRLVTGIEGCQLVDYRPFLRANDFELFRANSSPNEMICSELWRRSRSSAAAGESHHSPDT